MVSLLPLSLSMAGCGENGAGDDVTTSPLTGQLPVAFQGSDTGLWVDQSGPGTAAPTTLGMKSGTIPSQAFIPGGGLALAFQANTGEFLYDEFTQGVQRTFFNVASGTHPSIVIFPDRSIGFAASAATGSMMWQSFGGLRNGSNSGFALGAGASPSLANASFDLAFAWRGTNGHLMYKYDNNGSPDTNQVMAAGTDPSIATFPGQRVFAVAFQRSSGDLWFTPNATTSSRPDLFTYLPSGLGMKPGTSPAVSIRNTNVPVIDVAFQANTGELYIFHYDSVSGGSVEASGIVMANNRSPTIISTGTGFQAACKGFDGNLWVDLNGQIENQHMPMN